MRDSTGSVDISGWYLTDDRHDPFKYTIPDGTTIKARGYKTFGVPLSKINLPYQQQEVRSICSAQHQMVL